MKLLARIAAATVGIVVVVAGAMLGWLYFYTADLPPIDGLNQYDPAVPSEIHTRAVDGTPSLRHVIPRDRLGKYFVSAIFAAEGQPEAHGPIRVMAATLRSGVQSHGQMYSWQLARNLISDGTAVHRQIDELRLAEHIQRHYDQQQVLTIYANLVYLGENTYGVEDASLRYFGKHAADLSLEEAALLAGLIRSPKHDSPIDHPKHTVQRRNWVVDQMIGQGSVSQADAERAKTAPLIVKQAASSKPTYDWNRCVLKLAGYGTPGSTKIRVRPGETPTKQTPVITFEVLESGEVRNVVLSRSSGIADIDKYALASFKTMRYIERPLGCGIIDSQAVVNVDF